jgi:hypothetical protein
LGILWAASFLYVDFSTDLQGYALSDIKGWQQQQRVLIKTNLLPSGFLREPLYPVKELVKVMVVGDCDDLAHFEDASPEGDNATITWKYTYGL